MTVSPIQRNNMPRCFYTGSWVCRIFLISILFSLTLQGTMTSAVPMQNDPNGFEGIPWGATFLETDTFLQIEDAGRSQTYELKTGTPSLGTVQVDSMRFVTSEGKFARVTVRYQGKTTHEQILAYLQSLYGPIDRTPGQISGGAVKFFSWTGFETDVNLRYETGADRGIIFFESQELREK
jgi:hypothetical protein